MSHSVPLKVFVIDDDFKFGKELNDHLTANPSNQVNFFDNGADAIQNLNLYPDAVIVDYHLDGVSKSVSNGMVILEEIKKFDPSIHVIMLTSLNHYGVAAQTILKGAEQCVIKDDDALRNIAMILEDIKKEIR
ncbi:MAG: response regulator [Bacteroidia bacterium]